MFYFLCGHEWDKSWTWLLLACRRMNVQGAAQIPPNAAFYNAQNKGTLFPGQVIQIQSLTVTVDRFLSQGEQLHLASFYYVYHYFHYIGGFAHVYLVRTPTPVNGTTQHVLKRMLVADHIMLQDVKKEVDIMVRLVANKTRCHLYG